MKKINILFTCAGRRNYLINYFKEALNGEGNIIAADEQMSAPAMVDADIALKVPNIYDDNYIEELLKIVKTHSVTGIISLNDFELPILSKNKDLFEEYGTKVIVSNPDVISIGFDKWKTYNFLKELKINTPKTYIKLEKAIEDIENGSLKFPLVLKPRWGSASLGIDFPESMKELKLSYKLQKIKLKRSIFNKVNKKDQKDVILIQEKLDGKEYGMDIVNDFKGNYYGSFAKEKLAMRSGETDKAKSIIDERFERLGKKISQNLKHIGNVDSDMLVVNDKLYLLEINPRFGGGYPFSHEAGVNIAAIYIELLKGGSIENLTKYNNYKENMIFSKCDRIIEIKLRPKRTKAAVQIQSLEQALKFYKLDNGKYPTTEQGLQALVEAPSAGQLAKKWRSAGYLEKGRVPNDPWDNEFIYIAPGLHSDFDLMSYGIDGQPGGEGDDADINNWEIE